MWIVVPSAFLLGQYSQFVKVTQGSHKPNTTILFEGNGGGSRHHQTESPQMSSLAHNQRVFEQVSAYVGYCASVNLEETFSSKSQTHHQTSQSDTLWLWQQLCLGKNWPSTMKILFHLGQKYCRANIMRRPGKICLKTLKCIIRQIQPKAPPG